MHETGISLLIGGPTIKAVPIRKGHSAVFKQLQGPRQVAKTNQKQYIYIYNNNQKGGLNCLVLPEIVRRAIQSHSSDHLAQSNNILDKDHQNQNLCIINIDNKGGNDE